MLKFYAIYTRLEFMNIFDEIFHKVLKIKHFDTMRYFSNY